MKDNTYRYTLDELTNWSNGEKTLPKLLKDGYLVYFDNEEFCSDTYSDDFRTGTIEYLETFGELNFMVYFNGEFVKCSKTWKPCENKLIQLIDDFNVNIISIEKPFERTKEQKDYKLWNRGGKSDDMNTGFDELDIQILNNQNGKRQIILNNSIFS